MGSVKNFVKGLTNLHIPGKYPDILLFATPRGGSTWFMELVASQPGFKYCEEPLNLRVEEVRKYSGITSWAELYEEKADEKYKRYFDGIFSGNITFKNPNPLRRNYRFFTRRMIVKIIHGGVDRINWFRHNYNVRILYCLRHPIAVSISREEFPFLEHFLKSEYVKRFTPEQIDVSKDIISSGSKLQKGVLAWCLHNSVPLRDIEKEWAVVTYEQAVLEPRPLIAYMCDKLELPDSDLIYARLNTPSSVIYKSDSVTKSIMENSESSSARMRLISKWRDKVDAEAVSSAMELLKLFEIDAYGNNDMLPNEKYWIGQRPTGIK